MDVVPRGHADQSESVAAFLEGADLFAGLEPGARTRLAGEWDRVHVRGGEVVIRAGEPGDVVYLVVSGRLRVTAERGGEVVTLSEIGRGQVVGEMALLDDAPRNASVHAIRDSELLRLRADRFRSVIEDEPSVLLAISRSLVDRLRVTNEQSPTRSTVRTLAIVPAGVTAAVRDFAECFARELGVSPSSIVDERAVVDRFGDAVTRHNDAFDGQLLAWLQRLETEHQFVVYVADDGQGPWAERCARQADRVLLVADATADPEASRPVRATVRRAASHTAVDLVLLHPSGRVRPQHTARWLEDGDTYASHHHVRRGHRPDHGRVARLLTGRGVGLTLGGGGPRGFAHVGAFRAFAEAGLPIDCVGGTSIGSIMGGFLAMGWDQATIEAGVREAFIEGGRVIDRTLPLVSLSSARRLESLLRDDRFFGGRDLEDFWLPYFAVSTNLTRAEVVVDDRGPAWQAIRSSISLPGVLPAVCRDGDLLVDGGIMNNLPIDIMAGRLNGGMLVAIDLEPTIDLRVRDPFPSAISGWAVAAQRLNPLRPSPRIPGPLEVLLRTRAVGSRLALRQNRETVPVDLYLAPPVDGYGPLDFTVAPDLIERGYRYTLQQLENLEPRLQAALAGRTSPIQAEAVAAD